MLTDQLRYLDGFDDGGKERVSDIRNDDADRSGLLGAQRSRGPVWGVTMAMDGGEDTLAGQGSNIFRATESTRNRCETQIEISGEFVEGHKRKPWGTDISILEEKEARRLDN